ncbi:MAG: hypothetical protein E7527_05295 [Ruminococcaceae bacterium]|nr:hypothetical protein [Oscillospiraceae bacterium]
MLCPTCGTEYEGGACPRGCQNFLLQEPQKKKRRSAWLLWLCLVFAGFVLGFLVGAYNVDNRQPYEGETSAERTYKYSCQILDIQTFTEKADRHVGTSYVFSGEVIEVLEPRDGWNTTVALRVQVTDGDKEGVLFATVECPTGAEPIVKGNTIHLYGTCKGTYEYQNDKGETVKLPKIDAVYYDLKK